MYYTTHEVAEIMMVSPATIIRMIERGELEGKRFGKQYRIPKDAIEKLTGIKAST